MFYYYFYLFTNVIISLHKSFDWKYFEMDYTFVQVLLSYLAGEISIHVLVSFTRMFHFIL